MTVNNRVEDVECDFEKHDWKELENTPPHGKLECRKCGVILEIRRRTENARE